MFEGHAAAIGASLQSLAASFVLEADQRLNKHGLTLAQHKVLRAVVALGHCQMMWLAHALATDPSAMARLVDRLETKGLLLRRRTGRDRRIVLLEATQAGARAGVEVPDALAETVARRLEGWAAGDVQCLAELLTRLAADAVPPASTR